MSSIASLISASKKVKVIRIVFYNYRSSGLICLWKCFQDETCPCQSDYVGFAHLSEQVHRKLNKRGFQFTLMVVGKSISRTDVWLCFLSTCFLFDLGERGLGKTTLIQSLFGIPQLDKIKTSPLNNIHIRASTVDVEELGVRVRLTIISTPGYGDCIDETHTKNVLIDYIDQQFQRYFNDEYGFDRQMIVDQRVHCLLYLLSSSNRRSLILKRGNSMLFARIVCASDDFVLVWNRWKSIAWKRYRVEWIWFRSSLKLMAWPWTNVISWNSQ